MGVENRKHERIDTDYLVRITVPAGGDVHDGTCLNLSESGLFVQMLEPPPKGSTLHLELFLEPLDQIVHVDGTVLWVRPKMPDTHFPPGAGMRFVGMSDETRDLIREAIAEQKKRQPKLPIFREQKP